MTGDLIAAANILQLGLGARIDTDRWSSAGLVHRTSRGETAAGGRSLEIEYAPPIRLNALRLLWIFFVLFLDQRRP